MKLSSVLPDNGRIKKDEIDYISLYHIILSISQCIRHIISQILCHALGKDK